jgi:hypothetical protein
MRNKYRPALVYLVLGLILLQAAYLTFAGKQPVTLRNEQGEITGVVDLTKWFAVISWCALIIGTASLAMAIRGVLQKPAEGPSNAKISVVTKRLLGHRSLWFVVNILLIPLSIWTGYTEIPLTRVSQNSPDFTLEIVILIMLPLFVIAVLRLAEVRRFRKPTWDRFPLNWGRDPLQALFIASVSSLGALFGSLLRLTISGPVALNVVSLYASIFFGLMIGQILGYLMFRKRFDRKC